MASSLKGFIQWMDVRGANTLYLGENLPPMLRVNGVLGKIDSTLLTPKDLESCVQRFTPDAAWKQFEKDGHATFSCTVPGKRRARMSIFRKQDGFGAVIRLQPNRITLAEHHGMPKLFDRIAKQDTGFVLITGPAGSGKTSFLHSLIDHLNASRASQIVSLEHPIEHKHSNKKGMVIQRDLGANLKSRMRAIAGVHALSADVLAIDGMEAGPEACSVLDGSFGETLVIATMEAPSLVDGIELLSLMAPKSERSALHSELSRSLLVGIGQIIVPDLEGGQRPTREILFPSTAVQDLIQKGQFPALTQTMRSSKKQGMVSLDDYLHQMIKVGFADPEKAYELALDPGYLREEIAKSIKLPIGRFEPKDPVAKKMMKDLVAAAKSRRV